MLYSQIISNFSSYFLQCPSAIYPFQIKTQQKYLEVGSKSLKIDFLEGKIKSIMHTKAVNDTSFI